MSAGLTEGNATDQESGSASALNADAIASVDVNDYQAAYIQITGPFGATATFYGCNDNVNFLPVLAEDVSNPTQAPTTSTTTPGLFYLPTPFRYFRLRVTAYTSGTVGALAFFQRIPSGDLGPRTAVAAEDKNYGTVGTNTLRTASQIGNASGAADFNAGSTGAQTLRSSANITRNGNELSYNDGASDSNTLRTSSNLKRQGTDLDYNFGAVSVNTLRTAAEIGNASGLADFGAGSATAQTLRITASNFPTTVDTNYGTVGSSTPRSAAQIGNATGAADFNSGATGAQTLRVSSNLSDGNANKITSTTINSKQRLDVNNATDGVAGSAVPFQTTQVGGSDGTNLQALATDSLGRLKLAGSSYFHPTFTLRVQSATGSTVSATTSLVIPISSTSSGNLIAVVVGSSVAGTVTVTDNLSQTYSTAISGTSGTHTNYIFYKANTTSGVTSITISSTSSSGMSAIVTEYFGISASPLDKTSTGTVTGATAFSSGATATTTSLVELLLGSAYGTTKNNQTYTAGSGWNSVGTSNGFNAAAGQTYMEDQYVGVEAAYTATGTASGNDTIVADIATFIITNTSLTPLNQAKVIKSGSGILRKIIINSIGTGSPTLTIYDNTTSSGTTIIATLSLSSAIGYIDYNLNFTTGLTIVVNSSTADFTLVYD